MLTINNISKKLSFLNENNENEYSSDFEMSFLSKQYKSPKKIKTFHVKIKHSFGLKEKT